MYICKRCGDEFEKPYQLASHVSKHNREIQAMIDSAPKKVALSSIPFTGMFEFEGVVYRKTKYLKNSVLVHTADYVAGGQMLHGVSERAFDLKTLVTPK